MVLFKNTTGLESTQKQFRCFSVCDRDRLNSCALGGGGGENKAESGELSLYSPLKVVIFVAFMCGMLVLMYFFYNVLGEWGEKWLLSIQSSKIIWCWCALFSFSSVYIIIAIFCLASASALFSCFDAVMEKIGCGTGRYEVHSSSNILLLGKYEIDRQ